MISKKFAIGIDELDKDVALKQCIFKSCVSGSIMEIPIKNGAAQFVTWTANFIAASNSGMGWSGQSQGSLSRRLGIFKFTNLPEDSDQTLKDKVS